MKLSLEEVNKIAKLSRLELSSDEVTQYSEQLSDILTYIEQLYEADIKNVEETAQVTGLENVYRDDVIIESGIEKELVELAPDHEDGEIKVKSVF